jgi:hypothetical protein
MIPPECPSNWITSLITSGVTSAIAGLIGYFSAVNISKRNSRAAAVAKFRAAFAPAIARIGFAGDDDASDLKAFFKSESLIHAAAIEEFKPFVSERTNYDKVYGEYCGTLENFAVHGETSDAAWMIKVVHKYGNINSFYSDLLSKTKKVMGLAS